MKQEQPTNLEIKEYAIDFKRCLSEAGEELSAEAGATVVKSLAIQISRLYEAKHRIDIEGIVVRDLKGSVIPHPGIKIEQDATKLISEIIKKFKHAY